MKDQETICKTDGILTDIQTNYMLFVFHYN